MFGLIHIFLCKTLVIVGLNCYLAYCEYALDHNKWHKCANIFLSLHLQGSIFYFWNEECIERRTEQCQIRILKPPWNLIPTVIIFWTIHKTSTILLPWQYKLKACNRNLHTLGSKVRQIFWELEMVFC